MFISAMQVKYKLKCKCTVHLCIKCYLNKQMTHFSIAVHSDLIIYSTRLKNQGMATILTISPGRVLVDLRMCFFVFYDPGKLGVSGFFM